MAGGGTLSTLPYKQRRKQRHIQDWPNKSGITNLQDTGVWVNPGKHGWMIFKGGTGNTLPMPRCEDDDLFVAQAT